jgi:hypothetical protein
MKKGKLITLISVFLLCVSLFATLLLDNELASRIAEVVTLITAVVGAVALYLQFKRDKSINEASFLLEFWKSFSENSQLISIQRKCDDDMHIKGTTFTEKDYEGILTYAQWLEALSAIVNREVVTLKFINDMYGYMFFVFVNNKYIQEKELLPNFKYYHGIFTAYNKWVKYLKKHKMELMLENNALDVALLQYIEKNKKK